MENHYSLKLPDDWVEMDDAETQVTQGGPYPNTDVDVHGWSYWRIVGERQKGGYVMTRSRRSHVDLSSWYAATTTETQTMDPEGNITTTTKYTGEVKMTAHGKHVIAGSAVAAAGVFAAEIALLVELLDD